MTKLAEARAQAKADADTSPFCGGHKLLAGGCVYCGHDFRDCRHYYAATTCETCAPSPVQDEADA